MRMSEIARRKRRKEQDTSTVRATTTKPLAQSQNGSSLTGWFRFTYCCFLTTARQAPAPASLVAKAVSTLGPRDMHAPPAGMIGSHLGVMKRSETMPPPRALFALSGVTVIPSFLINFLLLLLHPNEHAEKKKLFPCVLQSSDPTMNLI